MIEHNFVQQFKLLITNPKCVTYLSMLHNINKMIVMTSVRKYKQQKFIDKSCVVNKKKIVIVKT